MKTKKKTEKQLKKRVTRKKKIKRKLIDLIDKWQKMINTDFKLNFSSARVTKVFFFQIETRKVMGN